MSLLFLDGADGYGTSQLTNKWTVATNSAVGSTFARTGGNGIHVNTAVGATMTKLFVNSTTVIVGAAMKFPDGQPGTGQTLFALQDSGSGQVDVRLTASTGVLTVTRNGTLLGTASTPFTGGVWHYLELMATIDDSAGVIQLRLDGVTVLSLSGVDTKNTGNAFANAVSIIISSVNLWLDDVYICNGLGSTNNTFLGDIKVAALVPNGPGSFADFTRGGADSGANWSQVNDATPNSDTNYNASNSVGNRDSFAFTDLTLIGTVFGVQLTAFAEKDDTGSRSFAITARNVSTDTIGTTQALAQGYTYYSQIFELDPNTGSAWSVSSLNSAEFGYELVS